MSTQIEIDQNATRFEGFIQVSTVILGIMTGYLIGIPAALYLNLQTPLLLFLFAIGGGLVGYRRRKSRVFFYFALLCVLALSSVIFFYALIPANSAV